MVCELKKVTENISLFEMKSDALEIVVTNFGGTILKILMPDNKGQKGDVVLGYDEIKEYQTRDAYLGALVGRVANRIRKGSFELNGKTYQLPINDGPNSLHGGIKGFSQKVFDAKIQGDSGVPAGQPAVAAVQPEVQKRLPDILLAEDNADFADFFVRHLSGSYTIHCATDGRQALDLLRSRSIAAVVSDVAMKGMDGVALCAAIRNDPALDHLPVVLVSVDSSSAAKVRALEAGADAYLEKPLSVDYLDCQIRALIGIRGRLRLKFSKMPYLVMDGDAASPSGNRFMAQVNQYVMDNISNSNLSVEDIAAAVNVSRTLFFSRIKSLTGTTPNEFLRSTRLRVAAELLSKSNDLRVTEICYMVGFTSTSYFAKCFHAQFGMLPTEFMEKYRRE